MRPPAAQARFKAQRLKFDSVAQESKQHTWQQQLLTSVDILQVLFELGHSLVLLFMLPLTLLQGLLQHLELRPVAPHLLFHGYHVRTLHPTATCQAPPRPCFACYGCTQDVAAVTRKLKVQSKGETRCLARGADMCRSNSAMDTAVQHPQSVLPCCFPSWTCTRLDNSDLSLELSLHPIHIVSKHS